MFKTMGLQGAPTLLVPEFTVSNVFPATATWTSPYATADVPGFTQLTLIQLIPLAACVVSIYKTPPGGALGLPANLILNSFPIAMGTLVDICYDTTLNIIPAGYTLWAVCSLANACNMGIHGINWS